MINPSPKIRTTKVSVNQKLEAKGGKIYRVSILPNQVDWESPDKIFTDEPTEKMKEFFKKNPNYIQDYEDVLTHEKPPEIYIP